MSAAPTAPSAPTEPEVPRGPEQTANPDRNRRYDAFISYSHRSDDDIAPALRAGLQGLAKPWYRRRAMNVFLDRTSMSADPALWTTITRALDDSSGFVLLLSPEAAQSPWVNREIDYWVAHRGSQRLLPVLTGGELVWDASANRFDESRSTAAPPALAGVFTEEPRYIDLRWADNQSANVLSLRDGRFSDAMAEIAAPLRGVAKDELVGADLREHRRTIRITRIVVAALCLLLVVALVAATIARSNATRAERRRVDAQAARLRLEASSKRVLPDAGFLLAAQSYKVRPGPQTEDVLIAAAQRAPDFRRYVHVHSSEIIGLAFDTSRTSLVSYDKSGSLVATNPTTGATLARAKGEVNGSGVFTAPGGVIVVGLSTTELRDSTTLRVRRRWASGDHPFAGVVVFGDRVVLLRLDGAVAIADLPGRLTATTTDTTTGLRWSRLPLTSAYAAAAMPDGSLAAVGVKNSRGAAVRFRIRSTDTVNAVDVQWDAALTAYPTGVTVSADGTRISVGQGALLAILDASTGKLTNRALLGGTVRAIASSARTPSYALAALANGDVDYVDVNSGQIFPEHLHRGAATAITWSPDGKAATGDSDGAIALLDTGPNRVTGGRTIALNADDITFRREPPAMLGVTSDGNIVSVAIGASVLTSTLAVTTLGRAPDGVAIASLGPTVVVGDRNGAITTIDARGRSSKTETGSHAAVYAVRAMGVDVVVSMTVAGLLQTWRLQEGRLVLQRTISDRASAVDAVLTGLGEARVAYFESSVGVLLSNAVTGEELARYPLSAVSTVLALAPDGKTVAVANGADINVYDSPGHVVATLAAGGEVVSLGFVDGGTRLAVADLSSGVRLLDLRTGLSVGLYVDDEPKETRRFAASDKSDAVAIANGAGVTLETFDPSAVLADGCSVFGRSFRPAELKQFDLDRHADPCGAAKTATR